jgi:hypothetical protein
MAASPPAAVYSREWYSTCFSHGLRVWFIHFMRGVISQHREALKLVGVSSCSGLPELPAPAAAKGVTEDRGYAPARLGRGPFHASGGGKLLQGRDKTLAHKENRRDAFFALAMGAKLHHLDHGKSGSRCSSSSALRDYSVSTADNALSRASGN